METGKAATCKAAKAAPAALRSGTGADRLARGGAADRTWRKGSPFSGSGITMLFSAGTHSPYTASMGTEQGGSDCKQADAGGRHDAAGGGGPCRHWRRHTLLCSPKLLTFAGLVPDMAAGSNLDQEATPRASRRANSWGQRLTANMVAMAEDQVLTST